MHIFQLPDNCLLLLNLRYFLNSAHLVPVLSELCFICLLHFSLLVAFFHLFFELSLNPSYFLHPTQLPPPPPLLNDGQPHQCRQRDLLQQASGDQLEKRPDNFDGTSLLLFSRWNYIFWFIRGYWSPSGAADADALGGALHLTVGGKAVHQITSSS